ncbi:MAG TPA: hypothetical protein VHC39_17645 [Rhizomicrobium sp.]|nr:hypothetical protein [Rhizomicrobium sp.]
MAYAQRVERDGDVGVKEAFRVLHQGLSCLAGQITATDSHSAHIAAQLTSNWEQLARRLSEIRMDLDDSHRVLDARLSAVERSADYSSNALEHALEKLEAFARQRTLDQAESQRQASRHEQVLERLSDALVQLEKRLPDSSLVSRLEVVEQAIGGLIKGKRDDRSVTSLLAALQALSHRLERLEKDHGDLLSELRARFSAAAPQPSSEAIHQPLPDEPPALNAVDAENAEVPDFEDLFTQTPSEPVNFLARARLSARAAVETPRPGYLFPAIVTMTAILALAAGLVLHRRVEKIIAAKPEPSVHTYSVAAATPPKADNAQPMVPLQPIDQKNFVSAQPNPDSQIVVPLKPRTVRNAPVHAVPEAAKPVAAKAAGPSAPADRVQQLADKGNAQALTILGLRALDGAPSAPANLPEAIKYLTQAAEKGQAVAQYRLGTLYEHGQGVAADPAKAAHWYELAANQGNRKAMHNLAVFYASEKDMANAARWFAKASTLGLSDSQFNLAVLYERGDGLPQSLVDAFKWYSIAAAAGDLESKARVSVLETQLNDADKATAEKAIASFRPQTFDHGANVPPDLDQLPSG